RQMAIADGGVEASEEEWRQHRSVELVIALKCSLESIDQKAPLAVQPALLLDEIEKEEPRQNQQGLSLHGVAGFSRELRMQRGPDFPNGASKTLEELARERFAIESAIEETRMVRMLGGCQKIQAIERVQ